MNCIADGANLMHRFLMITFMGLAVSACTSVKRAPEPDMAHLSPANQLIPYDLSSSGKAFLRS